MAGERTSSTQKYKSEVIVTPRFYDPEAAALQRAMPTGLDGASLITDVERSARFEVTHDAASIVQALEAAKAMARDPLSNPVSERIKSVATKTTTFPIMKVRVVYKEPVVSS